MQQNYRVLILGSDANAYYMARCYYEATHQKAHLLGTKRLAFTKYSNILTITYVPNLWDVSVFLKEVNQYAKKYCHDKILLVSTNETYSLFIAENQDKLSKNLYFNQQNPDVLKNLTNKELFYKNYKNRGLVFPMTYYFDVQNNTLIPDLKYPMIVKPANVVLYNHLSFEGKNKIYKINNEEELTNIIAKIKEAGYNERLILQEFVSGDDSHLFDSVVYVSKEHKVKLITFAQIGLQERSTSMVGNAAVLINGYSTFDAPIEQMKENITNFVESIDYTGFAEIDMKYDEEQKVFKVLEINARQGRSSYYVAALGANLITVLADDLISQKELTKKDLTEELLLSFVPKNIIKKYISNQGFKKKALKLWKKRVSPMECKLDRNFKRFLMIKKRLWHYKIEYKNAYWKE